MGIERTDRYKQARIADNTIWVSPTGEHIPVRDVVDRFVESQKEALNISDMGREGKEQLVFSDGSLLYITEYLSKATNG